MIDGKEPVQMDGSFLTSCDSCHELHAKDCLFSGDKVEILECEEGLVPIGSECAWGQIEGCKHPIDSNRPQCYSCDIGFVLIEGSCQ